MFLGKDYKVGKTNMPKANCHKLNGEKQQIAKRISTDPKANSSTKPSSAQFFMEITDLTVKCLIRCFKVLLLEHFHPI